MTKKLKSLLVVVSLLLVLTACDALEKTDLVQSEEITTIQGKTLLYNMYLTGNNKFRYVFMLTEKQDTTQLFEARFTDKNASHARMEIEQDKDRLKIILDKPTERQSKTVDGFTYELEGSK